MPWMLWPFGESISKMKIPAFFFFSLSKEEIWNLKWSGDLDPDSLIWDAGILHRALTNVLNSLWENALRKKKDGKNPTTWAFICFLDTLETEQLAGRLSSTQIEDVGIKSWLDLEWHSAHLINPVSLKTEHLCFIFLLVTSLRFFFVCLFFIKKILSLPTCVNKKCNY